MKFIYAIIFGLSIISTSAHAECAADIIGTVYCSKYPSGGAEPNIIRAVVCGKGQCKKDIIGTVHCSRVLGGGAGVDIIGTVRCTGGCEPATQDMCEPGRQ